MICDQRSHAIMVHTAFSSLVHSPPCLYSVKLRTSQLAPFMYSKLSTIKMTGLVSGLVFHTDGVVANLAPGIDILCEASSPGSAFDAQDHYDHCCFLGTQEPLSSTS